MRPRLDALAATSGTGSTARRSAQLDALFGAATADEQRFLPRCSSASCAGRAGGGHRRRGRQGRRGPGATVRRAFMLSGDLGETARLALTGGADALEEVGLAVGTPVLPMLAATAADAREPRSPSRRRGLGRVQARRRPHPGPPRRRRRPRLHAQPRRDHPAGAGGRRGGADLPGRSSSSTARRSRSTRTAARAPSRTRCAVRSEAQRSRCSGRGSSTSSTSTARTYRRPLSERLPSLEKVVGAYRIPGVVTADPAEAAERVSTTRSRRATRASWSRAWTPCMRPAAAGGRWHKVKPVHTYDLVVLGAEWGYGRRTGWLSNLHLGARDPDGGEPVMVGKTFKGLTDALLAWQTETFPRLHRASERGTPGAVAPRAGRGDRAGRRAAQHPLPRRRRAALRAGRRATGPTRPPRRPTRSTRCGRCSAAGPRRRER